MKKIFLILSLMLILITGSNVTAFADAITYDMEEAGYYVYVATPDGGLNMRHGPGTDYAKVMDERIPDGVRLYIGYTSDNWGYTSYNGNDGWVALRQTSTTPPETESVKTPSAGQPSVKDEELQHADNTNPPETEVADENSDKEIPEVQTNNSEDAEIVKDAMVGQIVLIAVLVVFVIIIAVLIVIIINLKSKRQ